MQKQRLLKLADALEANAKNKKGVKFDLRAWGYKADGATTDRFGDLMIENSFKTKEEVKLDCHTAACAVGYAAISGLFKRQGLGFAIHGGETIEPIFKKGFRRKYGWDAVMTLFDIEYDDAEYLFSADSYNEDEQTEAKGERAVAKRIREYVKTGKIPLV